jgi:predicted O-methyltransferase YrrM
LNFFSLYKRHLIYLLKKKQNIDNIFLNKDKSLEYLFSYFGTDKAIFDKLNNKRGHGYSPFYQKIFLPLKKKKLKLLEIGSFSGASAAAFVNYFDDVEIFCLDINISNFKYKSNQIKVFGLDIRNVSSLKKFFKKIGLNSNESFFDIIIDDGSHKLSDILFSINYFFPNLKKDGLYIIEEYNFPKYFKHLNDVNHIIIEDLINYVKNRKFFESSLIEKNNMSELLRVKNVETFKGSQSDSDIVAFKKN